MGRRERQAEIKAVGDDEAHLNTREHFHRVHWGFLTTSQRTLRSRAETSGTVHIPSPHTSGSHRQEKKKSVCLPAHEKLFLLFYLFSALLWFCFFFS